MYTIRRAEKKDVNPIFELIDYYAKQGIMLPRSAQSIEKQLDDFVVAFDDQQLAGLGSLCPLGADLVEIRSLGVYETYKGKGLGKQIVFDLEQEAKKRKYTKLMALTYEVQFFIRNGFQVVSMDALPEKVWTDCVHCMKRDCCDEIAVLKSLLNT